MSTAKDGTQSLRRWLALAASIVMGAGFAGIYLQFALNYGDSLIYLVFAKSMRLGFFYYGSFGPKGGATSPLWALVLSCFYWLGEPSVFLLKAFALMLLMVAVLGFLALSRAVCFDYLPGLVGMAFYVSDRAVQSVTAGLYELPLATLLVALALLSTVKLFRAIREVVSPATISSQLWLGWALTNGLLPLARPECILIVIADILFIGYWILRGERRSLRGVYLLAALASIGLTAWWNVFLYVHTGTLVPSSIAARSLGTSFGGTSVASAARTAFSNLLWTPFPRLGLVLGLVFLVGGLWWNRPANPDARLLKWHLLACALVFPVLFSLVDPGDYVARYMLPVKGAVFLLMGVGVTAMFDVASAYLAGSRLIRSGIAIILISFSISYGGQRSYASFVASRAGIAADVVLERDTAERLNRMATRDDRVLVYEIQTQYYLVPEALSMDGIVGGEIIPYLKKASGLGDFLRTFTPTFIVVSSAMEYRREYRGTILRKLFDADRTLNVGEGVIIEGFVFQKLFERPWEAVPFPGACRSIYRVDYGRTLRRDTVTTH